MIGTVCGRVVSGSTLCGTRHADRTSASSKETTAPDTPLPSPRVSKASRAPARFPFGNGRSAAFEPRSAARSTTALSGFEDIVGSCGNGFIALSRLPLEVAEDGAWIDAQVLGGLRAVAAVPLQNVVDVTVPEVLQGLGERQDRVEVLRPQLEVLRSDEGSLGEHHRLLDAVLELPDVARPAEMPDGAERLPVEPPHLGGELAGGAGEEELGEHGRVLAALAQGRQVQVDDVHAVVEVLAEAS